MAKDDDIVIVGVGCKFPGANNLREFWRVLRNGENHVKDIPRDRWNVDTFYDPDPDAPGKTYVRKVGFVQGIDEWDHRFYGINDMEAELIDPQQRLALDCVHMALEDGGITKEQIENTPTAVYLGSMTDDYKGQVMDDSAIASSYTVTGTHNSIISARISYVYNLHGPSMTIDTACSSSLVAIDVASQAIMSGKCTTAICGGVNVIMDPQLFIALAKARMLSPTGQCQTFTAKADGYARGEGCGIVILKKMKDALKDGNKIWGVIKTGTNQDGALAKPISAPAEVQQKKLIEQLYDQANVDKASISVIEAHGTGTPVGDPVEVGALGAHFGRSANSPSSVLIGSVKTNIGHLEAAAGVAGLIKVLLMMKYETVVPSLWYNVENENPKLKLSTLGFVVPTDCRAWKASAKFGRNACVNSFGFGGTNAHAIVEQYIDQQEINKSTVSNPMQKHPIITISAYDQPGLIINAQALLAALDGTSDYDIHALSYTSTCRRDHRLCRKAVHGRTLNEIKLSLKNGLEIRKELPPNTKHIVFVYCGVGTAWNGMCADLMKLPLFAQAIDQIDEYLEPLIGWRIGNKFKKSEDILTDPLVSHIAIFACQVGLTALWQAFGIHPASVIGQSVGEVAAAFASGYLNMKDAVNVIYLRSKYLASVNKGRMAVVRNVETKFIEELCHSIGSVNVAVFASDTSCTVSGTEESLQNLKEKLLETDADIIDIETRCAYHSHLVKEAAKQFEMSIKSIEKQQGRIPMFSTVTGDKETNGLFNNPEYWKKNVEFPVAFSTAVKASVQGISYATFVEIGPSPVLKAHAARIFNDETLYTVLPSVRKRDDMLTMADTICTLYESGFDLKWKEIIPYTEVITDEPIYAMKKYKHIHISSKSIKRIQGMDEQGCSHLYITHLPFKDGKSNFSINIDEKTTPFVFEHLVNGFYVVPGATYADIGFEIGRSHNELHEKEISVSLEFLRPVSVDKGAKASLEVSTIDQLDKTLFHVKHDRITICKGWVCTSKQGETSRRIDLDQMKVAISRSGSLTMNEDGMYATLKSMGFQHGDSFRMMKSSLTNGLESLTEISVPADVINNSNRTTIHPCILDALLQTSITTTSEDMLLQIKGEKLSFLPVSIEELRMIQRPEAKMFAYTKRINTTLLDTVLQVHFNVLLFNEEGKIIANLRNYTTYGKRNNSLAPCDLRYRFTWKPQSIPSGTMNQPHILLLTNTFEISTEELFQDHKNVCLIQPHGEEPARYIQNALNGNNQQYDVVMLLVHEEDSTADVDNITASSLHLLVKNNCMLLADLVRYMTEKRIKIPLFVVTQKTHPTFQTNCSNINIVGGELWGFVHSVLLEFIHGPITLVDVRPTIKASKDTLLQVMSHSIRDMNAINPDFVIDSNKVYCGQLTKDARCHITPSLRAEHKMARIVSSTYKVMTQRSNGDQFSCLVEDDSQQRTPSDHINIQVKAVCCHETTLAPRTVEGLEHDQDIWEDSMNDGYNLFGLEYTGYSLKLGKRATCKDPVYPDKIHIENEWEYVCIWPTQVKTRLIVPKSNVVHLKELGGQYEPGLLLTAAISWIFVDRVPQKAKVIVYTQSLNMLQKEILTAMLSSRKRASIMDPSSEHKSHTTQIDVMISFGKVDSSFSIAKYCKQILCLNGSIPDRLMSELLRTEQTPRITSFDAVELLKKKVPKVLSKVVTWLQRFKGGTASESRQITCQHAKELLRSSQLELPIRRPLSRLFSKCGIYIITGGMTGLGWEMTQIFAEMGAGIIALLSRRNVSPKQLDDINNLEARTGSRIICVSADVTNYSSLHTAIKSIRDKEQAYALKGVFHGAGVLNSKLLVNLEEGDVDQVLMPKVIGTLNMHVATKDFDLDYFVVASSINSTIGSPGQSSYGAANSFMDTFIEWRRRRGFPGQSINWGALAVGMASRKEFVDNFKRRGFNLMPKLEIRSCLHEALLCNSTSVIYTDTDWDLVAKDYANESMRRPKLQLEVLLEQVVTSSDASRDEASIAITFDVASLKNTSPDRQRSALYQLVKAVVPKVIGNDTQHVTEASTLDNVGFDSMSKVTFINIIRSFTGYQITTRFMADTSHTFNELVEDLFKGIFQSQGKPASNEVAGTKPNESLVLSERL